MSSHREAPEISKDPSADNTDVYAFVSPDKPTHVTLIANFMPFELPYGGPNFNEFADDVWYEIKVSNQGDAHADITYRFTFTTKIRNKDTFLYNTGPITKPTDKTWNRPQTYTITRTTPARGKTKATSRVLATGLTCPPVNVGAHTNNDYPTLAAMTYHTLPDDRMCFAGQRADGFHVDLGSIFDLGDLRPFQGAYALSPMLSAMDGVNGLRGLNVHTIALQVPITDLTKNHKKPSKYTDSDATIGVWATASRAHSRTFDKSTGTYKSQGGHYQVSRLANPLFNEVINPMSVKDKWNASSPNDDKDYAKYVDHPELAGLIATLYPSAFPNLAKYTKARADLDAILLTGIPAGIVANFQNYTGPTKADMLRLNVAIAPTAVGHESSLGVVGNDLAGFPNGRRPLDDVVAIELKAVAGATIPLVDKSYTPDSAASQVNDGSAADGSSHNPASNSNDPYGTASNPFLSSFPYLQNPNSGFTTMPPTPGGTQAS